jgi:hypothetical protein
MKENGVAMPPKKRKRVLSADKIAVAATRGEDVSAHFTGLFTVVRPVQPVKVSHCDRKKKLRRYHSE